MNLQTYVMIKTLQTANNIYDICDSIFNCHVDSDVFLALKKLKLNATVAQAFITSNKLELELTVRQNKDKTISITDHRFKRYSLIENALFLDLTVTHNGKTHQPIYDTLDIYRRSFRKSAVKLTYRHLDKNNFTISFDIRNTSD